MAVQWWCLIIWNIVLLEHNIVTAVLSYTCVCCRLSVKQVDQNTNIKVKQMKPKPEMSCLPEYNVSLFYQVLPLTMLGLEIHSLWALELHVREYWKYCILGCDVSRKLGQLTVYCDWADWQIGVQVPVRGREMSLFQCPHRPWGLSSGHQVLHHKG
jgi:hypothetical protein